VIKNFLFLLVLLLLIPITYAKPIPKISIDYPTILKQNEWVTIQVNLENLGDDAQLSGGVHIEVSGAEVQKPTSERFLEAWNTVPQNHEPLCETNGTKCYKNLTTETTWFEVLVKDLKNSENANLTFQIKPYSNTVKIKYRAWIPDIYCQYRDTSKLRDDYKQYWRNDECIERDPSSGEECDIKVYAAHYDKKPYNCYSKTILVLPSMPNWLPFVIIFIPILLIKKKNVISLIFVILFLSIALEKIVSKDYTSIFNPTVLDKKIVDASNWIGRNSKNDSVAITTWPYGPVVYTNSHRGVVLGTRVYPSEIQIASQRLYDLDKFFFSDEEISYSIAKKYNITHAIVFYDSSFQSSCKRVYGNCTLFNPLLSNFIEGTTYGAMMLEGNLNCFSLVYENSEVKVYKTTNCYSYDDISNLFSIARDALNSKELNFSNSTFKNRVYVSLWKDGEVRGSYGQSGYSIEENVYRATKLALYDERFKKLSEDELNQTDISISIVKTNVQLEFNPYDTNEISSLINPTIHGVRVYNASIIPEVATNREWSPIQFLNATCRKASKEPDCYVNGFEKFQTKSYVQSNGKIKIVYGDTPFSEVSDEKSFNLAIDWIAKTLNDSKMVIGYYPLSNSYEYDTSISRYIFASQALADAYRVNSNEGYLKIAKDSLELASRNISRTSKTSTISFYVLALWDFYESTGDEKYKLYAIEFSNEIEKRFSLCGGCDEDTLSLPVGITALYETYERTGEQKYKDVIAKTKDEFLKTQLSNDLAENSWYIDAGIRYNKIFDDKEVQDFVNKLAQKLLAHQHTSEYFPQYEGGFWSNYKEIRRPYTPGTGKILEALIQLDKFKYQNQIQLGLNWMKMLQIRDDNSFYLSPEVRSKAIGGFKYSLFDHFERVDNAAHFVKAVLLRDYNG
jgi:AMMECR1 domain-containing protein